MSLPSTLHHTSFTFDKLPPGQTLDQCLLKGIHNIIRQEDATDIPPLFSELLPLGVPSADHFLKEVAPAIGKAALVLALVVQSIKIKRSMTSYMISHVRKALTHSDTLDILAVKWGYSRGGRQLFLEIAKASVHPLFCFEGVAYALGAMLNSILVKFIGSMAFRSNILPRNLHPVGQSILDERSSPLPACAPVKAPIAIDAHHRIKEYVKNAVPNRNGLAVGQPWGHIVNYNLRCDFSHQAETVGDAIWGVYLLSVLWEERENLTPQAFIDIQKYLASNSLMSVVTPLFGIDASAAFTDLPVEKSRGDFLEAALGLAYLEDRDRLRQGGWNSRVVDKMYVTQCKLVELCTEVWNQGGGPLG